MRLLGVEAALLNVHFWSIAMPLSLLCVKVEGGAVTDSDSPMDLHLGTQILPKLLVRYYSDKYTHYISFSIPLWLVIIPSTPYQQSKASGELEEGIDIATLNTVE